ncbi:serine hydrolase [Streptomyces sp. H27-C3]|uniref:serine hydrolase n=1 Tax=Streptomyces sp. H27-C3 TaxID=3046305 RepID=UPI0024BA84F4|nr:serine hydrolase [Streptomyces sp. H27-C3]MDJ0463282.1 serine hydrolase [Streptomyces sp. H27-C3]
MNVSCAVSEPVGERVATDGDGRFASASIVKVGILAALLLRAQDTGRRLGAREEAYADAMIRRSDNDAATELWAAIGGAAGLDAALGRLGLTQTRADRAWGRTRTTARDQLALLRAVFGPVGALRGSVLSEDSRTRIGCLMERVVPEQAWGVSAAGSGAAVKNGWMPRDPDGLWTVNSIGRVTVDGRTLLVAVLSDGHATREAGVALVERVAREAVGGWVRR